MSIISTGPTFQAPTKKQTRLQTALATYGGCQITGAAENLVAFYIIAPSMCNRLGIPHMVAYPENLLILRRDIFEAYRSGAVAISPDGYTVDSSGMGPGMVCVGVVDRIGLQVANIKLMSGALHLVSLAWAIRGNNYKSSIEIANVLKTVQYRSHIGFHDRQGDVVMLQ
jgi:hypothetical protein